MKILHENLKNNQYSYLYVHEWHKNIGHRKVDHINRIKVQKCSCENECVDCLKGKISAPPFPKSSEKPKTPRTLITSDLCGQFKTRSLGGAKYFMTLINAATDFTEVVTLKHKSDTTKHWKDVKPSLVNIHIHSVQIVVVNLCLLTLKVFSPNEKLRLNVPFHIHRNRTVSQKPSTLVVG